MGNWLKTLSMTVNCPYCGTGYTFRSKEKFQEFKDGGCKSTLHPSCKKAEKDALKSK